MPTHIRRDPELCQLVVQMFKDGLSRSEIARRVNRSKITIRKFLVEKGFEAGIGSGSCPGKRWSSEEIRLLKNLVSKNLSSKVILKHLPERSTHSVWSKCRQLGIKYSGAALSEAKCSLCSVVFFGIGTQTFCRECVPKNAKCSFLRKKVILKLSNPPKCALSDQYNCCHGISDLRFLQVDHRNGGGNKERKGWGGRYPKMEKDIKNAS